MNKILYSRSDQKFRPKFTVILQANEKRLLVLSCCSTWPCASSEKVNDLNDRASSRSPSRDAKRPDRPNRSRLSGGTDRSARPDWEPGPERIVCPPGRPLFIPHYKMLRIKLFKNKKMKPRNVQFGKTWPPSLSIF